MLTWALARLGIAWFSEQYLPVPFYVMALGLTVGALLPGFLFLSWAVRGETKSLDLTALGGLEFARGTRPLRVAHEKLDGFLSEARKLECAVIGTRNTLQAEGRLPRDASGAAATRPT